MHLRTWVQFLASMPDALQPIILAPKDLMLSFGLCRQLHWCAHATRSHMSIQIINKSKNNLQVGRIAFIQIGGKMRCVVDLYEWDETGGLYT